MLNRKASNSGRNLSSLFYEEYNRHIKELAAGEEVQLAFLQGMLDVRFSL